MNLWTATNGAGVLLDAGDLAGAMSLVAYAKKILDTFAKGDLQKTPAICCFVTEKDGTIYCDKSVINSLGRKQSVGKLFPGTWNERVRLCRDCREDCVGKIVGLEHKLKEMRRS